MSSFLRVLRTIKNMDVDSELVRGKPYSSPRQVAIALQQAKSQGIEDIPDFKPLVTWLQNLEEWQHYMQSIHHENCNLKDRLFQYESEPDPSSEDNWSMADSLEREYTKERLRS